MLNSQGTALIVIDVQERLFPSIYMKDDLVKKLQPLIRGAQILKLPIILTEQVPQKIGKTIPEIAQILSETPPIAKNTFSCCGDAVFMKRLKHIGRKVVLICGIETHVCVYQTAADLVHLGYSVQVVSDCVSSRTAHNKVIGLERIKDAGASVTSVETALCELLKKAEGKKFKEILDLIK